MAHWKPCGQAASITQRERSLHKRRGECKSELPMHGGNKELGRGLVEKIKKDLDLK